MDLTSIDNLVFDYFVICHGNSNTHVKALSGSVEKAAGEALSVKPLHSEGEAQGEWVLIDFGAIVVHIFQQTTRERYRLEELWGDAKHISVQDIRPPKTTKRAPKAQTAAEP